MYVLCKQLCSVFRRRLFFYAGLLICFWGLTTVDVPISLYVLSMFPTDALIVSCGIRFNLTVVITVVGVVIGLRYGLSSLIFSCRSSPCPRHNCCSQRSVKRTFNYTTILIRVFLVNNFSRISRADTNEVMVLMRKGKLEKTTIKSGLQFFKYFSARHG